MQSAGIAQHGLPVFMGLRGQPLSWSIHSIQGGERSPGKRGISQPSAKAQFPSSASSQAWKAYASTHDVSTAWHTRFIAAPPFLAY